MPSTVNLKALGLATSPNELEVPEGSLSEASNIIIRRDNVIESRRGLKLFGNSFGSFTDRAKQLLFYKKRLLRHYGSTLQYENDDDTGEFLSFAGTFNETQDGLRIKGVEANSNFFFTTSDGIKKISADTSGDFTTSAGYITNAGGIKALDLSGKLAIELGNQTGFLPQDSKVSYRVVWGTKDKNNNLILGTPSQLIEISNPLDRLITLDTLNLYQQLDNLAGTGSLIDDGDYVATFAPITPINSDPSTLRINLIALAAKLDEDIHLASSAGTPLIISTATVPANGTVEVTFSSGDPSLYLFPGDSIEARNFASTGVSINGVWTVTLVTGTTLRFNVPGTAVADVITVISADIYSDTFRVIAEPPIPANPATDDDLVAIQTYLQNILLGLQAEPNAIIPTFAQDAYISNLDVTSTANVSLTITVPQEVDSNYFYQVYRSATAQATGTTSLSDISSSDELQLVIENYPTSAELLAREVIVEDVTPDAFRGANLYTNPSTGEGILQANDVPPFAKDIALYQNVTFYANTKTKQRKQLSLLGVTQMISQYVNGSIPKLVITNGTNSITYSFVIGVQEVTQVVVPGLATGASVNSTSFNIWDANDEIAYNVFYNTGISSSTTGTGTITITTTDNHTLLDGDSVSIIGSNSSPSLDADYVISNVTANTFDVTYTGNITVGATTGKFSKNITGKTTLRVDLLSADATSDIVDKTVDKFSSLGQDFAAEATASDTFTVTNIGEGSSTDAIDVDTGFTITTPTQGQGENASAQEVLLSSSPSPAQAVDATARSLSRVINKQTTGAVYSYYLSGATDVPGKMLLEARNLSEPVFYVLGNSSEVGTSFNPDISPNMTASGLITSITTGLSPIVTTSAPHGLNNGDKVILVDTNSTPSIDGEYTIMASTASTFQISFPSNVTVAGTSGRLLNTVASVFSENEERANRIYYSKVQQPEAVPIVNYFEVGPEDFEILRIFPLRNSLFVFKEDGLYRVSGDVAPFTQQLFDGSTLLTAPDSIALANNLIYGWTRQGIVTVSETGVSTISRPIDTTILEIGSSEFPNFSKLTWGTGYESDNSYLVFTNEAFDDTVATICYRYSNLTNTWTTFDHSATCGIVKFTDDKLYLGAGDTNFIEQERKTFSRLDYSDREFETALFANNYLGATLRLPSVVGIEPGDVIYQNQTIPVFTYNGLLQKLDIDSGVANAPITSIGTGTLSVLINTSVSHNLVPNDYVTLINTDCVPEIDGLYKVLTTPSGTSFTIKPVDTVIGAGSTGTARLNYLNSLKAVAGDNMRTKLVQLATKMDTDPGLSFSDYLDRIDSKAGVIVSNSIDNPTIVTTSAPHELLNGTDWGRQIAIGSVSGSVPTIDGSFTVGGTSQVTFGSDDTFTVPVNVITPGTGGTFATLDQEYLDILACFNIIVQRLNDDTGAAYNNYMLANPQTTELEAVVLSVDRVVNKITLSVALEFEVGPLTVFKAIPTSFAYTPLTMGDPLGLKQVYESTMMFQNKAFTNAVLAFKTDLRPEYIEVPFNGDGNGIFGIGTGNFGNGFFGGGSNGAPFRTIVPRNCQRCRYIIPRFGHAIAREKYSINGLTLTANIGQSTRAYR